MLLLLVPGTKFDVHLCVAPYNYVHSDAYTKRVNKMLVERLRSQALLKFEGGSWVMKTDLDAAQIAIGKKETKPIPGEIPEKIHNGSTL